MEKISGPGVSLGGMVTSQIDTCHYTNKEFFKICEDYGVPHDPMKYRNEKFYWTYQHGVRWSDDYIGPD